MWGENIYIDVEPNINFCIRQVRGVLLDEAAHPRYIETVPREGYRFLAALASSVSEADLPTDQTDLSAAPADLNKTPIEVASVKPGISRWLMVAIALAALMIVGVVLWLRTPAQTVGVTRILPVTTYPGDEREPSLSPDGHQVAFHGTGEMATGTSISSCLANRIPCVLLRPAADDTFPVWSPDGKHIAFIRNRASVGGEIMLIPSIGGPERSSAETHHRLFLLSTESGATRPLLSKAGTNDADDDASPAFSPDGYWLVCARFYGPFNSRLWFQRITDDIHTEGEPLAVSNTMDNATAPVWLPDSKRVLFLDSYGHRVMQAEMGHPARLVYATEATLEGLTFSSSEQALVTSSRMDDTDLSILPLKGLSPGGGGRNAFLFGRRQDRVYDGTASRNNSPVSPFFSSRHATVSLGWFVRCREPEAESAAIRKVGPAWDSCPQSTR